MNSNSKTRLALGTALAFSAFGLLSAAAHAQDTGSDIIVTARRVEERLQDVPISITVFNQQQLAERNIVNAQDLAAFTPSLSANSNFGPDNTSFSIRGFVQEGGTAPSVGVYFADVVSPRAGISGYVQGDGAGPGSFFDLQNVQVLKGPQGTLQGRNTTGGSVLLVPTKPTGRFEGYVEGTLGNYDLQRIQAVLNAPLGDRFRMRLGIDRMTREGYLNNTTTDPLGNRVGPAEFGDVDYTSIRASFVADLTPNLENYTIISYTNSRNNGNQQKLVVAGVNPDGSVNTSAFGPFAAAQLLDQQSKGEGFYDVRGDLPYTYQRTRSWQIINTTTWRASDTLTLKNITSYAQFQQSQKSNMFGTDFKVPGFPGGTFYVASIETAPGRNAADQSTFTEEFQLQGNTAGGRLTYQGGVYFEASAPLATTAVLNATLLPCIGDPQLGNCVSAGGGQLTYHTHSTHTRDIGIYGQASYAITDQLKLTGGLRYTWDKTEDTSYYVNYTGFLFPGYDPTVFTCGRVSDNPATCTATLTQESQKPTWLVGLDYKPTSDLLIYGKYSRGYRTGGVFPTAPPGFFTFEPEKVDTYEVGAKTSWRGPVPGLFNLTGYYNDFSNQQLAVGFFSPTAPPTGAIANIGKSRIYGLEAELSVKPFKGFSIDAGYAYLNTKILQVSGLVAGTVYGNYILPGVGVPVGGPLLLSPKHKLTVTGTYTLPLPDSIGQISVGATYTYQSSQQANYSDTGYCTATVITPAFTGANTNCNDFGVLPSVGLLNLNASWKSVARSNIDLSFFITNVTKKQYYNYLSGILGYGFETANVGLPRMFGVSAKARF
ncbi:MAG TPA: TonB-dependent receptor [Sphingobium sp.]|uniref:TonB-dependent receptor n=1 Tax=Sphingobium sp. TaxID=1912891 RepID=UPI002ED155DA